MVAKIPSPPTLTFFLMPWYYTLKLGRSSDVWSLGCILYQLVYGRPPFAHLTMVKKIQCIGDARYEIPFENITDDALLHVMRSCLQRNPKKRPTIPQLLQHPYLTGDHVGGNGGGAAAGMSEELMLRLIDQVLGSGLTRDSSDVDKRKTAKVKLRSQVLLI